MIEIQSSGRDDARLNNHEPYSSVVGLGALTTARRMACESLGVKKLAIAWWMDGRCRSVRTRSRLLCHSTSCRCTQQRDEINRLSSRRLGKPRVALADDRAPDRRAASPAVDSYVAQGWRSGWWRVARDGRRTPQGAGISPMLANVFPHYVLDLWIHLQWRKRKARGRVIIVRQADDCVPRAARAERTRSA